MDMTLWTKALLEVYPKLHGGVKKSEKIIDAYIKSCFASSRNAEDELYRLFDLIKAKNRLFYLKKAIEKAIDNAGPENLLTLKMRYFDNVSFKEIAEILNINIRNVFRKVEREIFLLKEAFLDMGIDEVECEDTWGSDAIVDAAVKKVYDTHISYDKSRLKAG